MNRVNVLTWVTGWVMGKGRAEEYIKALLELVRNYWDGDLQL